MALYSVAMATSCQPCSLLKKTLSTVQLLNALRARAEVRSAAIIMNMNANPESIYDKLNNVHASLRKQKEDAFRGRNLAEERLRLARLVSEHPLALATNNYILFQTQRCSLSHR